MQFVRVTDAAAAASALKERLLLELQRHDNVLWLIGGGSSIPLDVQVMNQIPDELTAKLTVGLTDERFGPIGHPDSNMQQLMNAGLKPRNARIQPILMPSVALRETCERYSQIMESAFQQADVVIAQFGIGPDGHIAGVLPGTVGVESPDWVVGYEAPQFTRISLSLHAIKRIPLAYAFVFGDSKREPLTNLRDRDLPLEQQPAQILKQIPESYVYNDQIGDSEVKEAV